MTLTCAAVVFLTSLLALPTSYVLNSISNSKNQGLILVSGLTAFCIIAAVPWLILRQRIPRVNSFYYVLSVMTYSSVLSLMIALGNDGLIAEFMGTYLREGEPYLKTAHGTMISYWDGIAHFAMYLMMLAAVSWNQSFHDVGLFWAGSFGYSKLVLILALLIGKDGLKWPFLLHVPYIVICTLVCANFIGKKQEEIQNIEANLEENASANKSNAKSIWRRPLDLCLLVYFLFAMTMTAVRFSGTMHGNFSLVNSYRDTVEPYLTDPSLYSRAQLMVQAFYFIPFYVMNIYALLQPGQSWILPWCIIFAGASGQAQFSLIGSAFHYRTPYMFRVPQTLFARSLFWLINGLQFAVPQLIANRCLSDLSFYLKATAKTASSSTHSASTTNNSHHDPVSVGSRRGSSTSSHSLRMKKSE